MEKQVYTMKIISNINFRFSTIHKKRYVAYDCTGLENI